MALVENLIPRLLADAEQVPLAGGGCVLVEPRTGAAVELAPEDLPFLAGLDGTNTLGALARQHAERHGEPGFRRLVPLCRDLAGAGLLSLVGTVREWPEAWGVAARASGSTQRPWRLTATSEALGRVTTRLLTFWARLPAPVSPLVATLLTLGVVAGFVLGDLGDRLPDATLTRVGPCVGLPLLLTAWLGLGLGLTVREKIRAAVTVALGGRIRSAGLALRWLVPVLVLDPRDAARAGGRGRRWLALGGLAGTALGTAALALCAVLVGATGPGVGLAIASILTGAYGLGHLCPLLPGDFGAALAEWAPDDRFAPRLRSYLARGMLSGMRAATTERRGIARRPQEERFYLIAAVACGVWTAIALTVLREVADRLGDGLLAPAIVARELPLWANGLAAAFLAALALATAVVVALALAPLFLWVGAAIFPGRARTPRPVADEAAASPDELRRYPLFGRLAAEPLAALAAACRVERFRKGDVIVRQGDRGDAFYALRSGIAEVRVEDDTGLRTRVAQLEAGDSFGELALVDQGRRRASVVAVAPLVALRLGRPAFEAALAAQNLPASEVTEMLRETHLLARLPFFAEFSADALAELSLALKPNPVAAGETVVRQGDRGEHFYVVQTGRLDVSIDGQLVGRLGPGDCFGEVALLQRVARTATVTCTEAAHLLRLDEGDFMRAVDGSFRFGEHVDALSVRRLQPAQASAGGGER